MTEVQRWHLLAVVYARMSQEERRALAAKARASMVREQDYVLAIYAAHRKELKPLWFPDAPAP